MYYLFITLNDVEPLIQGPYKTEQSRDSAARTYRKKHGTENGIFMLNIKDGKPTTEAYSGGFFA